MKIQLKITIESLWEAEQVAYVLLDLEATLRENPDGIGNLRLANKLNIARSRLQEEAGLVVSRQKIEDMFLGRGATEAVFRKRRR